MVTRLAAAIGFKRQTSDDKYRGATIRVMDQVSKQYVSTDQAALIRRFAGYVAICARLNAQATVAVRVRLYRKGKPGSRSRALEKAERRRLYDPMRVGVKAAQVADRASDDFVEVMDHPAITILNRPHPWIPGEAYWDRHERYKEVGGNAYDHIVEAKDRPWLFSMMPQFTTIQPHPAQYVSGYWYGRDAGKRAWFPADEVGHAKFEESLLDPFYGTSPLSSIVPETDLRALMNQYASSLFTTGARPDVHIHWEGAGEDTLKKLKADFTREYSGPQNAGKWFMSGGAKATTTMLGFAMKDLEYLAGRAKLESDIAAAFGVPESFLRLNDSNLASSETGGSAYQRLTVLPRAIRRADYLGGLILVRLFNLDPDQYWFAIDDPVGEDFKAIEDGTRADVLAGILTVNEARIARGYEPIADENAESLLINGRPLAESLPSPFGGFGSPPPNREPDDRRDDDADTTPGGEPGNQPSDPAKAVLSVLSVSERETKALPAPCCPHGAEVSQRAVWMDGHKILLSEGEEAPYADDPSDGLILAIRTFFERQRDQIIANMQARPMGKQTRSVARKDDRVKDEVGRLLDAWGIADTDDHWSRMLVDIVQPEADSLMARAGIEGFRRVIELAGRAEVGEPVASFNMTNERAAAFVRQYGEALYSRIQGVSETTTARLAHTLEEGVRDGEALYDMTLRVRAAFDGEVEPGTPLSLYRAKMIARTEVARAQTGGTLAGWAESGVVEGKTWLLSPNACEFCEAAAAQFNSKQVGLDTPFFARGSVLRGTDGGVMRMDFDDVQGADLHPHCKCSVQPVLVGGNR